MEPVFCTEYGFRAKMAFVQRNRDEFRSPCNSAERSANIRHSAGTSRDVDIRHGSGARHDGAEYRSDFTLDPKINRLDGWA